MTMKGNRIWGFQQCPTQFLHLPPSLGEIFPFFTLLTRMLRAWKKKKKGFLLVWLKKCILFKFQPSYFDIKRHLCFLKQKWKMIGPAFCCFLLLDREFTLEGTHMFFFLPRMPFYFWINKKWMFSEWRKTWPQGILMLTRLFIF